MSEDQVYEEILQRVKWLLGNVAGGEKWRPEQHDPKTRAYYRLLSKILKKILYLAGYKKQCPGQ